MKFILAAATIALASSVSALSKDCSKTFVAQEGDNCHTVAEAQKVSPQQLYRWNFVRNKKDVAPQGDCSNFVPGETYCLEVSNKLRKRNWFYKTKGLTGQKLALAKKKIASKKKSKKTSKKASKKTTKKAKKTTKKTTKKAKKTTKKASGKVSQSKPGMDWSSTPKNAPSSAVRHIISTCTKYATVDTSYSWCGDFAERNNVSLANLYKWNAGLHGPSAKSECDNLDDGKSYCIKA